MPKTAKKPAKKPAAKKAPAEKKEKFEPVQAPRGTQDTLPTEQKYWEYVVEMAKSVIRGFGWQQIDTPIFEEQRLFERGIGEEAEVVNKEMFELKSRSSSASYALRPEATAAIARAYIEHGMRSWPKPVKLFTVGPFFRYERPQAGRLRQHHQISVETFGSGAAVADAQVIYVLHNLFKDLGLENYVLQINSIGLASERKAYLKLLKDHYRRNRSKMSAWAKEKLKTNPLRVLDSKEEKDIQLANTAPRLLDHLSDASRQRFDEVLKILDDLEVPYDVNPSLVRGLDYYTHTVFEFVAQKKEDQAQLTFASGGRYDGLVKTLGGRDTACVGAGIGIERVIDQLKEEGVELSAPDEPVLFISYLGDEAKREALLLARQLQQAGIPFVDGLGRDGMQAQLKLADRLNVSWSLIVGHKEVIDKTVILRSMESGMQEVIARDVLVEQLRQRLNLPEM